MATPKKAAPKKTTAKTPTKRVYKKRVPKKEVEKVGVVQKVKDWYKEKKTLIIVCGLLLFVLVLGYAVFKKPSLNKINKQQQKKDVKYEQLQKRFDSLATVLDERKTVATEEREEAEDLEAEAKAETKQAEENYKKKEKETTVNYTKAKQVIYDKSTTQRVRDSLRDAKLRAIERLKGEN